MPTGIIIMNQSNGLNVECSECGAPVGTPCIFALQDWQTEREGQTSHWRRREQELNQNGKSKNE